MRAKAYVNADSDRTPLIVAGIADGTFLAAVVIIGIFALFITSID